MTMEFARNRRSVGMYGRDAGYLYGDYELDDRCGGDRD